MMHDNVNELRKDELDILMAYTILSNCCKRGLISKSSLEKYQLQKSAFTKEYK